MKNKKLESTINTIKELTSKNSPTILTGLAVAGLVATAILAYKAAPKMNKIIDDKKKDLETVKKDDHETKNKVIMEGVKEAAPVIAPVVIMGAATTACIIGSNRISTKRVATLSAAYTLAEKTCKDLNTKMTSVLGEKKTREIKDAIRTDNAKQQSFPTDDQYVLVGNGNVRCIDAFSERPFWSSAEKIERAVNKLSADLRTEMYVSLNDFYHELGLKPLKMGDEFGWYVDDTYNGSIPIEYTAMLDDNKNPVLYVDDTQVISLRNDRKHLY